MLAITGLGWPRLVIYGSALCTCCSETGAGAWGTLACGRLESKRPLKVTRVWNLCLACSAQILLTRAGASHTAKLNVSRWEHPDHLGGTTEGHGKGVRIGYIPGTPPSPTRMSLTRAPFSKYDFLTDPFSADIPDDYCGQRQWVLPETPMETFPETPVMENQPGKGPPHWWS